MTEEYFSNNDGFLIEHNFTEANQEVMYHTESGFGFVTGANGAKLPLLKIPETNSGFIPKWWYGDNEMIEIQFSGRGCTWNPAPAVLQEDLNGRSIPLCFRQDVPGPGCYRLTLTLWSADDAGEVLVFAGRRRLAWRGEVLAGKEVTVTALCDVSPIIPRGKNQPVFDPNVSFAIICSKGKISLKKARIEKTWAHTVYIMGDSTVTDQTGDYPYAPGASYCGWGQMLGVFLPDGYCASNHAHSGLTTESFRSEGHWNVMKPLIKKGDICLMQFGHNDQKVDFLQADEGYTRRLEQYISEIEAVGAKPVLISPVARNSWNNPQEYNDMLAAYAEAVTRLGRKRNVPVLDLHGYSMEIIRKAGLEGAKRWFYPSDYTHTNDYGAYKMAGFLGKELQAVLGLMTKTLCDWEPKPPLTQLKPPENCQLKPPEDTADNLKVFAAERPEDPITRIECLELVSQRMRFFPINVYNDLYDDVLGHETYAGTVQCAAQNHMIPDAFVTDGKLHPHRSMTLLEFVAVLMPAYASRKQLHKSESIPEGIAQYAQEAVKLALGEKIVEYGEDWNALLSRRRAAQLCSAVEI